MNYDDIKAYVEAGDSVETITAKLLADTRHVRDIMATGATKEEVAAGQYDLLHVLRSQLRVLRIGSNAEWKGSLVDYFNQPTPTDPVEAAQFEALKAGFEELLTSLQLTGQTVYCGSDAMTGYLVTAMTQLIGALIKDPETAQAKIDALTGGVRFAGVTEEEVKALIDERNRSEANATVTAKANAAIGAAGAAAEAKQTPAQIIQAANNAWGA